MRGRTERPVKGVAAGERVLYSIYLDSSLWKRVHKAALKEGKHLSDVVRSLLAEYVAMVEQDTQH